MNHKVNYSTYTSYTNCTKVTYASHETIKNFLLENYGYKYYVYASYILTATLFIYLPIYVIVIYSPEFCTLSNIQLTAYGDTRWAIVSDLTANIDYSDEKSTFITTKGVLLHTSSTYYDAKSAFTQLSNRTERACVIHNPHFGASRILLAYDREFYIWISLQIISSPCLAFLIMYFIQKEMAEKKKTQNTWDDTYGDRPDTDLDSDHDQ
jgi:hypothetical protein